MGSRFASNESERKPKRKKPRLTKSGCCRPVRRLCEEEGGGGGGENQRLDEQILRNSRAKEAGAARETGTARHVERITSEEGTEETEEETNNNEEKEEEREELNHEKDAMLRKDAMRQGLPTIYDILPRKATREAAAETEIQALISSLYTPLRYAPYGQ